MSCGFDFLHLTFEFKDRKTNLWLVLFITLVIRLININQSLWLDEAIEVLAVKNNSYWDLITKYALGDFHPPLHYLILKFWTSIFGYSEISARFPSVIFGVLTVYFVYLIGKKLIDGKTGIIAGLFMAISPLAVYYSQEARMYALTAFVVCAAFYFFLNKNWGLFTIGLVLAIYSHYLALLILPVFLPLAKEPKKILSLYFLVFLAYLLWLPFLFWQWQSGSRAVSEVAGWGAILGGFELKTLPLTFVKFIIGRISLDNKMVYFLTILPLVSFYGFTMIKAKSKLLWLWLLLPLVLGLIVSLKVPLFSYFRFLFVLPAFVLLLADGAGNNKLAVWGVCLISLISLIWFNVNPKFQRESWREAVKYMEADKGLAVMPSLAQAAPIYYYRNNLVVVDALDEESSANVYLIRYLQELFDPKDSLRLKLEDKGYLKTEEKSFNGVLVWRYKR